MKHPSRFIIILIAAATLSLPFFGNATVGVGIGSGKIHLDGLKPGGIYDLPNIPVVNTGDENAEYGVAIQFNDKQPELKPDESWFTFTPATFSLSPGASQVVHGKLTISTKAAPGDYFAYVEAHPIKTASTSGGASVSIAAASKLSFQVVPSNVFLGLLHRLGSLMQRGSPWSFISLGVLVLFLAGVLAKKVFHVRIAFQIKKDGK